MENIEQAALIFTIVIIVILTTLLLLYIGKLYQTLLKAEAQPRASYRSPPVEAVPTWRERPATPTPSESITSLPPLEEVVPVYHTIPDNPIQYTQVSTGHPQLPLNEAYYVNARTLPQPYQSRTF